MRTALILLDLQNEMVHPDGKVGGGGLAAAVAERGVIENASRALGLARERGFDVAHVRLGFRSDYLDALSVAPRITQLKANNVAVVDTWGTEFPDALKPAAGEIVITKQCVNPFFNTGLMAWLQHRGVERVVFGGVATNLVVESTARASDDAGFAVVALEDCCASPNAEWHNFCVKNMLPLFGSVETVDSFFAEDQA